MWSVAGWGRIGEAMIYCVVPREMADELYPKLVKHYEGDENVTVIVERRHNDRRARGGSVAAEVRERRVVRDRRRARIPGDLPPLVSEAA
jgi:hypothetical protein